MTFLLPGIFVTVITNREIPTNYELNRFAFYVEIVNYNAIINEIN